MFVRVAAALPASADSALRNAPLDISRDHGYRLSMNRTSLEDIKQNRPFRTLSERIVVNLMRTAKVVEDYWRSQLKAEAEMSVSQYNVLRILRGAHPGVVRTSEVAERMIHVDPDVTRLVDRLVRQGLVRRQSDPADRRVVLLGITDAGRELVAGLDGPAADWAVAGMAGLSPDQLEALDGLLDDLRAGVPPTS
jgi:DNA-binding MarR family transcriptional regulator